MRSESDVRRVFDLRSQGCSKSEIARPTGVSRSQIREWRAVGLDAVLHSPMREHAATIGGEDGAFCRVSRCPFVIGVNKRAYACLLGQYLGDGMLSLGPRGVFKLRVTMCDAYPGIMAECLEAIRAVMPTNVASAVQRRGRAAPKS